MKEQSMLQVEEGRIHISDSHQAMADALPGFNKKGLRVVQFIRTPLDKEFCFIHALCEQA